MENNQYLDIFIEEANEHLQSMNESLLSLEKSTEDISLLNEIFRVSHTLKGMAATMGFNKMADLTHKMEDLLHEIRSNRIIINTNIVDLLFECFDLLEEYINVISNYGNEGDLDSKYLIDKLNNILNKDVAAVDDNDKKEDKVMDNNENYDEYVINILKKAKEKDLNSFVINIELHKNCMLKSARAFIIFRTLEKHSEIVQSNPSVEDIEDEKFDKSFSLTIVSKLSKNKIEKEINNISEIERIDIKQLNLSNVNVSKTNNKNDIKKSKNKLNKQKDTNKTQKQNINKQTGKIGKTVRVDIDRLDNLMNLVSELIIIKTRMEDIGDSTKRQNMSEAIEYLERITTNLHDAVMKVRMVPIERVFNRFPRMVRDLSKDLGKKINLEMSGEETEVDRTVIDEIGDPLIHLIRNSIDHGIEKPTERKKLNKSETGTVKLTSYPDGNNVVIEVQDDGSGVNIEKVQQKAIENGVITEDKIEQLTDNEIAELIFEPGFSTAESITDVSGRGVGLDVVKSKIESIGGIVEISTEKQIGTKFTIRIPLTLAIIQALLVKIKNEIYAIPLSSIKEISPINRDKIRKVQEQEVVLFRNKTLPIIRLNSILGIKENNNKNDELIAVIVKKGEKEAGLIVDNLIGQQEIVIKSLGKYLANTKHIAGATILGNGKISLILDINSIF